MLFDYRLIFRIVGWLLLGLAVTMTIPAIVDLSSNNRDWTVFLASAATTLFVGGLLVLSSQGAEIKITIRLGVLLTISGWLGVVLFASLPLAFCKLNLSFTDAFFEAMSGLTTTGSTVISGLDVAPPGILVWRALLQWFGGIGIIAMGAFMLPFLRVGGMQLFRLESSEKSEKIFPQFGSFLFGIAMVYLGLTVLAASVLILTGLKPFEAALHAMTTVSTGGYSTSDGSIGHFNNPALEWAITVFMALSSLPFLLYLRATQGRFRELFANWQVRSFFRLLAGSVLAITVWLWLVDGFPFGQSLRLAAFHTTSIVTTTGFATGDYTNWGSFPVGFFFVLTVVGGCTGSTAGGIKIYRFQLLWISLRTYLRSLIWPHTPVVAHYGGRTLPLDVMSAGVLYIGVFLATTGVISILLDMIGLDFVTGITAAATAVANVGPGLGNIIGPAGNFAPLPDLAKWLLSFAMLLGRLEVFTILLLLTPGFWRW